MSTDKNTIGALAQPLLSHKRKNKFRAATEDPAPSLPTTWRKRASSKKLFWKRNFSKRTYQSFIGNLLTCYNEVISYNNAIKKQKNVHGAQFIINIKNRYSLEPFCIRSGTLFIIKQTTNVNRILKEIKRCLKFTRTCR